MPRADGSSKGVHCFTADQDISGLKLLESLKIYGVCKITPDNTTDRCTGQRCGQSVSDGGGHVTSQQAKPIIVKLSGLGHVAVTTCTSSMPWLCGADRDNHSFHYLLQVT